MTKTRSFSIYLLKSGFNSTNALKEDNKLEVLNDAANIPEGANLFIADTKPVPPWWKSYFGIPKDLSQVQKGAIIFINVSGRCFAITFGNVYHNLLDNSYEYDFGLLATLNCIDPDKLKSTDILEPNGAKRQRTQLPIDSDLTYFDFDSDSTILKSLTGKVKNEYKELFSNVTGSSNIRISSKVEPAELSDLCARLYELYNSDAYKISFPNIQNIAPIRDPDLIKELNAKLVEGFVNKAEELSLTVPKLLDFNEGLWATFSGVGQGLIYDDVFITRYYEYLEANGFDLATTSLDDLRKHQLVLTDADGKSLGENHRIFKCFIYDTTFGTDNQSYHLCEGSWYQVEDNFSKKLLEYLDPLCNDTSLENHVYSDEGSYNEEVSALSANRIKLDKENFAPDGQKQVEPCDIYEIVGDKAVFHHIKISTLSAQLSHLFNQGTNSLILMRSDDAAFTKLKELIASKCDDADKDKFCKPLEAKEIKIAFGIITHKDKSNKSLNLPLFSRISLMRCMKEFRAMGVEAEFSFIKDDTAKSAGKKKARKAKASDSDDNNT